MARRKITLLLAPMRPRNPLRVAALVRRAGPHGSTPKAARQQARQGTQRHLAALLSGETTEFDID